MFFSQYGELWQTINWMCHTGGLSGDVTLLIQTTVDYNIMLQCEQLYAGGLHCDIQYIMTWLCIFIHIIVLSIKLCRRPGRRHLQQLKQLGFCHFNHQIFIGNVNNQLCCCMMVIAAIHQLAIHIHFSFYLRCSLPCSLRTAMETCVWHHGFLAPWYIDGSWYHIINKTSRLI